MTNNILLEELKLSAKTQEDLFKNEVLSDFWICCVSREASLQGRREVLTGKAKFGILGDGKEVPQVAMARAFKKGDWRSGYYRDQTFMFAIGESTVEEYFAQLYADVDNDPWSGGRQMNSHYASKLIDKRGNWLDQTTAYNISSDISCTAGQVARAVGLAMASKLYRQRSDEDFLNGFSEGGDEVCFCTIGDASTSEGAFWETLNAAAVEKIPLVVSVWDDGYGISVPVERQTVKGNISKALEGFHIDEQGNGIYLFTGKAWDYAGLVDLYERAIAKVRKNHIPGVIHIQEATQPQGHSTSGSHERYKSEARLEWEKEADCITKMAEWMVSSGITDTEALEEMRANARIYVKECRQRAWNNYLAPAQAKREELAQLYTAISPGVSQKEVLDKQIQKLMQNKEISMAEVASNARKTSVKLKSTGEKGLQNLDEFVEAMMEMGKHRYETNLYSNSDQAAINVPLVNPIYSETSEILNGYQVLNKFFDRKLEEMPNLVAFGEDVGKIGDVNQGFAGLQSKYGEERVFDSGIREWTIIGTAIGLAMRGFRPIAEIQYIDYLLFGLAPLSDDLASLRYRTNGIQQAPAIIRTRGHRLEGIWHSGSPMGLLLSTLRGLYVCVPRNMVQASGMYNTLLQSNDPAIIVECLNGYRLKERLPDNIGKYTVPLGVPETLRTGDDITLVTYGSCVRVALAAIDELNEMGIGVDLIDVQTLLPFDMEHRIVESVRKTNRVVFLDEDVPGGATAFMLREVLEVQGGYYHLDEPPVCITAAANRPPYGSDGDYFVKPNPDDVVEKIYHLIRNSDPNRFQ